MRRGSQSKGQQQLALALADPNRKPKRRRRPGVRLGRPPKGPRSSERHEQRPDHNARHPLHVTLRIAEDVVAELGTLRCRDAYLAVRQATFTAAQRPDARIVHFSIQHNHIHLLVEAAGKDALARGMKGFEISAAKHLNAAIGKRRGRAPRRRGQVFADRYNARALTSPRQVRHAICYVLNNWRRHDEDRYAPARWKVDPYSTGHNFPGWKERERADTLYNVPKNYPTPLTSVPKTWLLRYGWERGGPLISVFERPGSQAGTPAPRRSTATPSSSTTQRV